MDHNSVKVFIILVYLAAASSSSSPTVKLTSTTAAITSSSSSPPTIASSTASPSTKSVATTTPVTCGSPSGFKNGQIIFPNTTIVGSQVHFVCLKNYVITGTIDSNATLTCMANGNWSDIQPTCSPEGYGLNFTSSKSQFIEGANGTIDLVCSIDFSIFNDFMLSFQVVIISRDNNNGSTDFLAKLDLYGNTTMSNSSNNLQKILAVGLVDNLKSPRNISLKLSLNESYLSCEDEATYRCHVSYTDKGSKPRYAETYMNLTGFFRPKEATLTAKQNGTFIPETSATNSAQVQVGDELELNCSAMIGSDSIAEIDMYSNTKSSSILIPVTAGLSQYPATKANNCQYSKTGILKHIVSVTDPGNMTFACEATAHTPDSYQIKSTNQPQLFIEIYSVCPRPTLDHGSIVLSGTSINSTAMLTCDPGYQALYSPSAICLSSGNWNMNLKCVSIGCGLLEVPNNGTVHYSDTKYAVGSNATFICNDDFFINGTSDPNITLTCTSGGVWDRPNPSCSSKDIGLTLEFSKNPFVLKSTDNVTIMCSVNWQDLDNMVSTTYELLIRRQKHTLNIWEQLGKLDNTGHVTYINDSLIIHTMELTRFWDPSTFSNISLSLTVNETYLHCEDATLYECYLSYTDLHSNRRYAAISKHLYSANLQSSASLTATRNGSVLPDTNSTNPALIRVGDVLELNCTTEVGSDRSAKIMWESTTSVSLDTLIVYPPDPLTKSDVDQFENCQSVRSETIQHVITASDPANMTFACKASFMSANGTTLTNNPRFYLDIYSVCRRPSTPEHGFISLGGTTVNATAEYSCENGFKPSSGFGICLSSGSWDTVFSCKEIDCGNLTEPTNGTVYYVNGTGLRSVVEIHCDVAYMLNGSGILECQQDGSWSNKYTTCVLKSCSYPSVPDHGFLNIDQGDVLVNKTVTFGCYPGFLLVGAENITCQQNITWTNEVPECVAKNCTYPVAPANGTINVSEGLAVNSTATISCRPGFNLTGLSTIHCLENTSWSESQASCVLIECPYLKNPDNGLVNLDTGSRYVNDTATYSCYPGYALSSNLTIVCTEQGIWSSGTPKCTVNNCTEPSPQPYGLYNVSEDCSEPKSPKNGKVNITDGLSVNSSVRISCNPGYLLSGPLLITCLENASWSSNTFNCNAVDCGNWESNVSSMEFRSKVIYHPDTKFQSFAIATCNEGYRLINSTRDSINAVCRENATWSIAYPPMCETVVCSKLNVPQSVGVFLTDSEPVPVNTTATFYCKNNMTSIIGARVIRCQASGEWNNKPPNCLKIVEGVPHCLRENDTHGNIWNETEPGTTVIKQCQTNYTGQISRQCTIGGKWLLPIYDCITQELQNLAKDIAAIGLLDNPAKAVAVVDSALGKLKTITSKPEGTQIFSGEIEKVTSVLENIANISEKMNVTDTQTKDFLDTTSNLLDSKNTNAWKSVDQKDSTNTDNQDDIGAEKILTVISKYSDAVAKTLNSTETNKTVAADNLVLHVSKITNATKDIVFPDSEAQQKYKLAGSFRLPYQAIEGLTNYSSVVYKNLSGILSSHSVANGENGTQTEIRSSVISVKIDNWQTNKDFNILLTLEHFNGSEGEPHCSFWNDTESGWDGAGCTLDVSKSNKSVTSCNCSHLTNFAILMSPIQDNVKNKAIDIITITGCSLSLIALVLTVAVHAILWRYLKSDRVVILMNLSVALIISYLIFLIGVDRTENKAACTAVAVLLQYIYLVVFFLMLAEGIEIGVSVLYVFVTKSRLKWLLPAAWLIPAVIVGISLGATQLKGYGNDQFCWLSVQGGLIWAFIGPACTIIIVNFVLLVLVIKAMFKAKTLADKSRAQRTKAGVRCLCVLLPLMGCTWLIGIFYVNKSMAWIQYVFAICNGLQGLVIFICHCAMNKQIQMAIQRRKKKYFDSLMSSKSSSKPFSLPRASTASTSQFQISNSFSGDYESTNNQGRINSRSNRNSFEMMPSSHRDSSEMNASLKRRL